MKLSSDDLARLIDDQGAALVMWAAARCDAAEDVVQEAFCRLATEDPPPVNCVAWLYTVCRNLGENERLRSRRQSIRERATSRTVAVFERPEASLERQELIEAVKRIDHDLREVLIARIWGQLGFEEIGKTCGISTASAFRRYEAALVALRSQLSLDERKNHVRIPTE